LNLAACDTLQKKLKVMKDALELIDEITYLIMYSPRRESIFKKIKQSDFSSSSLEFEIFVLITGQLEQNLCQVFYPIFRHCDLPRKGF